MKWMLTATLCICGVSVFTSCSSDNSDNAGSIEQAKKDRKEFVAHTRATLKDLAENLNFSSWNAANELNTRFNQYVLNNPDFEKAVLNAFMQKVMTSVKPVEAGSELAAMGYQMYGTVDLTDFNYRFTMNAEGTGFDVEAADDFEVILNAWNPTTQQVEAGLYRLTLKSGGSTTYKFEHAMSQQPGMALVVLIPSEFQFSIADRLSGQWHDGLSGSFKNEVQSLDDNEFFSLLTDSWTVSGTVNSNISAVPSLKAKADATTLNFLISDNPKTKEIKREFSYIQNGRNMLSLTANGRDEFGIMPIGSGPDMGERPDMGELGPEKPDFDDDGEPDDRPTSSSSESQLLSLLRILVGGKSFDKLSFTLLDDLTTTLSISDCDKALTIAQEGAAARRAYADEQAIDQYTQQLNEIVKAKITCKGVNQEIPMRLMTTKFGVDWWTMPSFNFADENGYVSFVDLLDSQSVAYGINIIDHAAAPMQQSIIVVRQLLQYLQGLVSAFQQQGQAQQGQSQQQGVVTQ